MTFLQRWGRWLSLALVAVLNSSLFSEEREFPRELLVVAVAVAGLLVRVRDRRVFASQRWLQAAFLFGAVAVAEAAGVEAPGRSLYGPYEGHQGALAWCATLMLMASTPGPEARAQACETLFGLGVFEALVGLRQFMTDQAPTGTLGHAMFLALLLTLAALAGFGLLLEATARGWRVAVTLGLVLVVLVEVLAARRMPVAALAGGLVVILIRSPERRRLRLAVPLTVIALLLGSGLHRPESAEYLAQRLTSVFDTSLHSAGPAARLDYYRVAWGAWNERPWLGWGFGAFRDLYAQRKSPGIAQFEARVHNLPLEMLLSVGLIGILAMVPLLIESGRRWRVSWQRAREGTDLACLVGGPAYLLCLMTNFDQPAISAWGFSLLAFPLIGEPWAPLHPLRWMAVAGGVAAGWLPAALGDVEARRGVDLERAGERTAALAAFRVAIRLAPHEELYRLHLVTSLRALSPTDTWRERLDLLQDDLRIAPRSPFPHEHLAIALEDGGQKAEALAERRRAVEMVPGFPGFHDGLARALFERGQASDALAELTEAERLDPWWAAYRNDRANVLVSLGRRDEARAEYQAALRIDPHDPEAGRNLQLLGEKPTAR